MGVRRTGRPRPDQQPSGGRHSGGLPQALHREAPGEAPANPNRGVPLEALGHDFDGRFTVVGSSDAAADVRRAWEPAVSAPAWAGQPVWIHGDLHPANVVVSDGTLCGVIDFGDMCAGDPATDLAAAWLLLPAGTAPRFFDAYASADDAVIRRARGWAALRALGLIGIGHSWEQGMPGGEQTWGPAGWAALDRVLASGPCSGRGS